MSKNQSTIAELCNNPLNIRFNPANQWQGQQGCSQQGFCIFKNIAYGFRAAYVLLSNYIKNDYNTIEKIINRWAPPSENNTKEYIRFVCDDCILDPDELLFNKSIHDYWTLIMIIRALAKMESGTWYDEQQINLYINYPHKY